MESSLEAGVTRPVRTPTWRFTVLLGVLLVVGALALIGVISWLIRSHTDEEVIKLTRQQVETHFRSVFGDAVFTGPLETSVANRFDSQVKQHFGIYDVVQLRLYTANGRMIYNYLPGLVPPAGTPPEQFGQMPEGLTREHQSHIHQASLGVESTQRTAMAPGESVAGKALGGVLTVYVPIRRDGEVIGVAEVYRDVTRQDVDVQRMQLAAGGTVLLGCALLFGALVGVYWQSTRRLRRQGNALLQSYDELAAAHGQSLEAMASALETRDRETEGHSERVMLYSRALGEALGLSADELAALANGALLHDIGKIGVPDAVLRKPGPLTAHEWEQMRRHPEIGSGMVGKIAFLAAALPVVRHHHERFDGTGYPERLAQGSIPLAARIFAVADTFDAMTSDRPYRKAVAVEVARDEIAAGAGTQFDPEVVRGFLAIPDARLREIRRRSATGLGRITRAE